MTKREWEKKLGKSMKSLSKNEVARVIAYYDELYEDKVESGMSEEEIIREFGDPSDAAAKILGDSDAPESGGGKHNSGAARVVFLIPFAIFAIVFAALTLSVLACGAGSAVCGAAEFVIAFVQAGSGFWATAAKIGVGIGLAGAGMLLFALGMKMGKACRNMFAKYFGRKKADKGEKSV